MLSALARENTVMVNSHHHQAIEKVADGLIATAWTSDGMIEALEDPDDESFVLAVQWHPEIGWRQDEFSQSLFARFVTAASQFRTSRQNSPVTLREFSQ